MKTILLVLSSVVVLWGSVVFVRDTTRDTSRVPLHDSATVVRTQYRSVRNLYRDSSILSASDTVKIPRLDTLKPHAVTKVKKAK